MKAFVSFSPLCTSLPSMAAIFLSYNTKSSITSSLSRFNLHRPSSSSSYRPMKVTMFHNQSYWTSINAEVEAHLEQAIPIRPPLSVFEPMHHLVFAAPRSMAPALCIAACEVVGGERDDAIAAASALHLMHAAAFTHEHLQVTDRPKPKPTIHHRFNANIELLAADGIFPFGYELLARSDDPSGENSERILRVVLEITRAMGSQGMVDGQYWLMQCMGSSSSYDDDDGSCKMGWIDHVCEKKEGGFYACGAACGAILGGGSGDEIERLRRYGFFVGMIHGMMLNGVGRRDEKELLQVVEGLRTLGLKELEGFKDRNVESISSLIGGSFLQLLGFQSL